MRRLRGLVRVHMDEQIDSKVRVTNLQACPPNLAERPTLQAYSLQT